MAEIVVTATVTVLIEKLLSGGMMKLARSEGIDSQLKKMRNDWEFLEAVLADANEKHITQRAVRLWLNELHHLAYNIDDVLDDMATETMRRKFSDESHGSTSTNKLLKKIVPTCCTNFTPHNMMYGRKISSKLDEITTKLNDLVEQKSKLDLVVNLKDKTRSKKINVQFQQTSLVDVSTVLGREGDTEELLRKLLVDEAYNQNVSVMSIVGLGGIGKTTLAKVLYNDKKVTDHFKLRAWVYVSDEFDVFSISKAIYQAVAGGNKDFNSLDLLHVALKEKLFGKRFLIVLDDVWNEDHNQWQLLKSPFIVGSPGSKIIVTTRKKNVALVMDSFQHYNLEVLSNEISLSLFANNALNEENFDRHPSLKLVAESIIRKCHGLPLALVTLGRVLKTKGTSVDEWEQLLNSEIWNLEDGSSILPALKLSYYDLPLHLKRLFAYCSLFPKGYLFKKEELVLLWMAEGFLLPQSTDNNIMECLGRQYFEELRSRSFFQHSVDDESYFTMHDLMNDLAISVAGEFFCMLDDKMDLNDRNEAFEKFHHFSFLGQRGAHYRNFTGLRRSKCLRTFLLVLVGQNFFDTLDHVLVELLPRLQFLRVLSLTQFSITSVPQSVGGLKHLRYLNFSGTTIKQVPEEVSELYNLQCLLVRYCFWLSRLPVSFVKLNHLRHFDIRDTPSLETTPLGLGRLTSLQTLSKFIIKGANGFKISELKGLLNLQGQLSISGLEKVKDPQEAKDANLEGKKDLVHLDLEWSYVSDDSRNSETEYEVIQRLRPPTKLNKLTISRYWGMEFPSWLEDPSFDKITELIIKGCRKFRHFTGIAYPSLEYLEITDMEGLEIMSNSNGDNDKTTGSFPYLRELCIKNCPKLAEVSIGSRKVYLNSCNSLKSYNCPNSVKKLEIVNCSSMTSLTLSTTLLKLGVIGCNKLASMIEKEEVRVNVGSCSNSIGSLIRKVTLWNCDSLESYDCPNSVETLFIYDCKSMTSLSFSATLQELPSALKSLSISSCRNLKEITREHLQSFTSLEELEIQNCESMDVSFPCGFWPPNLRKLEIGKLKKSMSEWGVQNYPPSLVQLVLYGDNSGVTSFAMEEDASNTSSSSTSCFLPTSLTDLIILDFNEVESISEILQHLTYLKYIGISDCPNIKDVPQATSSLKVYVKDNSSALPQSFQRMLMVSRAFE